MISHQPRKCIKKIPEKFKNRTFKRGLLLFSNSFKKAIRNKCIGWVNINGNYSLGRYQIFLFGTNANTDEFQYLHLVT